MDAKLIGEMLNFTPEPPKTPPAHTDEVTAHYLQKIQQDAESAKWLLINPEQLKR
jgi:hypothetical protein